ncbi:Uncharacterized protein YpbQ, isoprenylcysteine carboxyl methyltransferase (ICMT) family [Tistlia consotensis]|uniref:Uncharacterized protein YpbQ, isoprenylcysteine carboxyl methyltransferase (ICMT) family n=1 Tax=Tistlia consotensis USBA 355 TaxID=560819 RepID=A0A1Y6BBS5_9PROT|nr:isoprenylcysteine carboxylmethyltransferase family protein [Tistlia consotensis]SME96725.1 Uncharacterized protein YpbQ, isoprenylcysteine carboxyl methyltransferase (ICMT) family [Tistlia consotensis USBA 355]SNR56082.1 Uncharacterized protein YpbQ, isoprenylcysteine carboxyl methyltransferase (ICMT) family [Tistlia consotensis]
MTLFPDLFIAAAVAFRVATLAVSIRHERALKRAGAEEHGAGTSALLAAAHVAFYLAAIAEGLWRAAPFDAVSLAGLLLYGFGAVLLLVVIRLLGRFWTVKLIVAPDHRLVEHPLFRRVRHPNYFLNILPELAGFALALHAWATLAVGLPLYLVPLVLRIRQEERVMQARFEGY